MGATSAMAKALRLWKVPVVENAAPVAESEITKFLSPRATRYDDPNSFIEFLKSDPEAARISSLYEDSLAAALRGDDATSADFTRQYDEALASREGQKIPRPEFRTGEPITVRAFHGSNSPDIFEFLDEKLGSNTRANSAKRGHFFAGNPKTAESYLSPLAADSNLSDLAQRLDHYSVYSEGNSDLDDLYESVIGSDHWAPDRSLERPTPSWNSFFEALANEKSPTHREAADLVNAHIPNLPALPAPTMYPVMLNMKNPLVRDWGGAGYQEHSYTQFLDEARAAGHDSAIMMNTPDGGAPDNIFVTFDPKGIRSQFAKFDPENIDKADIRGAADPELLGYMGAGSAGTLGLGALQNPVEEAPQGDVEPGMKDYALALLRSGIQGTAADIAGGLTGLARLPREGMAGFNDALEQADAAMGYEPEGAEYEALANVGKLLQPIAEPIGQAVDAVGESNPALGAALHAAPILAPYAGKAARVGNKILAEELRRPSGAKSAQRGHFRYFDYTNEPSESRAAARSALKELDENGVPAAEVWKQYGWGREPVTNRPITEISDSRLDVPSNKLYRGPDGGTLLFGARKGDTGEHLLKDSILQGESYLKYLDPNYKIRGNRQKNLGSATHYAPFATESGLIEMGPQQSYADFMDVLVHELNHGMQSRFGAPRGGSPEQFGYKDFEKKYFDADEEYRNHIESLMDKLPAPLRAGISSGNVTPEILGRRDSQIIQNAGRLPPDPEIQRILIESLRAMEQKKLFKSEMRGARKKYENLHGEAMSRLAQNRRNLDPQLIRALYPFEPKYFQQQTGTDIGDLDVRF